MPLSLAAVVTLATACIADPSLAHMRDRLVAHVMVESNFEPFALHDNADGAVYHPATAAEATRLARRLVTAGHSVDGGLAQVNSQHWGRILPIEQVFDARANLCAASVILAQDYEAACRYNTGQPYCKNGYPEAVANAQRLIWQSSTEDPPPPLAPNRQDDCADVPRFDAWAKADCRRQHERTNAR